MGKSFPKNARICSAHFEDNDFVNPQSRRRKLRCDSYPSKKLPVRSSDKQISSIELEKRRAREERSRKRTALQNIENAGLHVKTPRFSENDEISNVRDDCRSSQEAIGDAWIDNLSQSRVTSSTRVQLKEASTQTEIPEYSAGSTQTEIPEFSAISTQTEIVKFSVAQTQYEEKDTKTETQSEGVENNPLVSTIFKNIRNEEQLTSCTGLSSFTLLNGLCTAVNEYKKTEKRSALHINDQVLLTLLKLKLNCSFVFLSVCFNVDRTTISRCFASIIRIMSAILKNFIISPSRDKIRDNIPYSFRYFPNTIFVLDCTEVAVCCPSCIQCRTQTWSHYKHRHTVKPLIGITPDGLIVYVGPCHGGKASDNYLFSVSGLLDRCQPGDAIMVDKGFKIEEQCMEKGVTLIRPTFIRNNEQLGYDDCEHSRKVASARVHVERVMERIKNFRILQDEIQWNYLYLIDDIFVCICAIVNLSPPILALDAFNY